MCPRIWQLKQFGTLLSLYWFLSVGSCCVQFSIDDKCGRMRVAPSLFALGISFMHFIPANLSVVDRRDPLMPRSATWLFYRKWDILSFRIWCNKWIVFHQVVSLNHLWSHRKSLDVSCYSCIRDHNRIEICVTTDTRNCRCCVPFNMWRTMISSGKPGFCPIATIFWQ